MIFMNHDLRIFTIFGWADMAKFGSQALILTISGSS